MRGRESRARAVSEIKVREILTPSRTSRKLRQRRIFFYRPFLH